MPKKCLTCLFPTELNNDELPEWVKKAGEDDLLPSILILKNMISSKIFKKYKPEITNREVEITIKDKKNKDTWIDIYWASNPYDRKKRCINR